MLLAVPFERFECIDIHSPFALLIPSRRMRSEKLRQRRRLLQARGKIPVRLARCSGVGPLMVLTYTFLAWGQASCGFLSEDLDRRATKSFPWEEKKTKSMTKWTRQALELESVSQHRALIGCCFRAMAVESAWKGTFACHTLVFKAADRGAEGSHA